MQRIYTLALGREDRSEGVGTRSCETRTGPQSRPPNLRRLFGLEGTLSQVIEALSIYEDEHGNCRRTVASDTRPVIDGR